MGESCSNTDETNDGQRYSFSMPLPFYLLDSMTLMGQKYLFSDRPSLLPLQSIS
jgi:hypothetical protein